jgi:Flp pilus assembly pilin Flp
VDRKGTTAIEYAVIASMISILIITGASAIGTQMRTYFQAMIAPFL